MILDDVVGFFRLEEGRCSFNLGVNGWKLIEELSWRLKKTYSDARTFRRSNEVTIPDFVLMFSNYL